MSYSRGEGRERFLIATEYQRLGLAPSCQCGQALRFGHPAQLYEVGIGAPTAIALVITVLGVSALASYAPARRAARINPLAALRNE